MMDPSQMQGPPGGAPPGAPGPGGAPPDPMMALNALRMLGRHGKKRPKKSGKRKKGK